ncbi:hypothetical protein PHMEG_00040646, partial [Phytophthora megakarya]
MRDSMNKNVDNTKDSESSMLQSWHGSISSLVNSTRESTFHGFDAQQNHFTATKNAMAEHASNAADGVSNKTKVS